MLRRRGFTLIEMLVVLSIMAALALAARPVLQLSVQRQKEFALREALRSLRNAIDAYKQAADAGRISQGIEDKGYPPNLEALTHGVVDIRSPIGAKIYFLRRIPRDPFADPSTPASETWALRSYGSSPDEPRPGRDVFDVQSRSEGRALDGSLYRDW